MLLASIAISHRTVYCCHFSVTASQEVIDAGANDIQKRVSTDQPKIKLCEPALDTNRFRYLALWTAGKGRRAATLLQSKAVASNLELPPRLHKPL